MPDNISTKFTNEMFLKMRYRESTHSIKLEKDYAMNESSDS